MNELLYKKIDNCIREKMHEINTVIREEGQESECSELVPYLTHFVIMLCAGISTEIRKILEQEIHNA